MTRPTTTDITRALESIEATERDEEHPRAIARRKVAEWRSLAEIEQLPLVNQADTGAPRLAVDEVLKWEPKHLGRKV